MIISKTPLRISFFSGGSDLRSFYEQEPGAALSVTIDKFIYTYFHPTQYINLRTIFETLDEVDNVDDIKHIITREAIKHMKADKYFSADHWGASIGSISDIRTTGSGLGSSSAFTVGLVNCIQSYLGLDMSKRELAEESCKIEIEKCGFPIGKQDQFAAAYGGWNLFEFYDGEEVVVHDFYIDDKTSAILKRNLILVYSGRGRSANELLKKQSDAMTNIDKFTLVRNSRDKAYKARKLLLNGDCDSFGSLLHEAWLDKKQVVNGITQTYFDDLYDRAIKAGALGGKLLGAGGGGFFLFYVPDDYNAFYHVYDEICKDPLCKVFNFQFTNKGSEIVFNA